MESCMFIGGSKDPVKIPEKQFEPPRQSGLKLERGEDSLNFEQMVSESNMIKKEEIEREKNAAGGDFKVGETKNDREFRQQLEKVTGKKQDKAKNKLERDDYLNLLVTQLKYQDPTKPMEHYEMASQMAQFNTVEQLMGVNKVLAEMKKLQNDAKAEKLTQYLGKDIELEGNEIRLNPDKSTSIAKFELPIGGGNVIVEIKDENSKKIKNIPLGSLPQGNHKVVWDGTNEKGVPQPIGKYSFNVVAANDEGKNLTVKTSFVAKVQGISDLPSGGKLDTDVGTADPAKIIAIRNPEKQNAPIPKPYLQQSLTAENSKVPGAKQDVALPKEGASLNTDNSKNPENTMKESPFSDQSASEMILRPFDKEPEIVKKPVEVKPEIKNFNSTQSLQRPSSPKKEDFSAPMVPPKYGGPPTVNGIHGRM